jgi:hypothetical protein
MKLTFKAWATITAAGLSINPGDVLSINPGVPAVVLLALASFCGGSLNSTPPYRSTIPSTEG